MNRSDYVLLSDTLAETRETAGTNPIAYAQWERDCIAIGDALASITHAFDRSLFLHNCGVQLNGNRL